MPDYKKLSNIDIYISGEPTPEGDKTFSEFLKSYKAKYSQNKKANDLLSTRKKKATVK